MDDEDGVVAARLRATGHDVRSGADDDHPVLHFIHVMKAAGTSVAAMLQSWVGTSAVWPSRLAISAPDVMRAYVQPLELLRADPTTVEQIDLVRGHYPACTTDLLRDALDRPVVPVTVLRDPVERTLSLLRQHRAMFSSLRDCSLDELYDDAFVFQRLIRGHQTKVFSLRHEELFRPPPASAEAVDLHPVAAEAAALREAGVPWPEAFQRLNRRWPGRQGDPHWSYSLLGGPILWDVDVDDARLEAAKAAVAEIPFVAIPERVEDLADQVADALDRPRPRRVPHINRGTGPQGDRALRRRIAADCPREVALYEHVVDLVERRLA